MELMIKGAREIFKNDIKAIKSSPVVLFVLIVIICIPALYALLNIQATWDPYAQTSSIKIAVVNEDLGSNSNGTDYNMGNMFTDELKNNTDFNWQFVDKQTALDGLQHGKYYAAIIIPNNFSSDLLSIETSDPHQAHMQYVVNDKLNPVSPRITNAGVDAIQSKVNDEVVKTVDGLIFGKLSDAGELAKENKAQFLKTKSLVNELNGNLGDIDSSLTQANSDMATVNDVWSKVSANLPQIKSNADYAKSEYDTLYGYIGNDPTKALSTVQDMELKVSNLITSLKYMDAILTALYNVTGDPQLKTIITQVEGDITQANTALTVLKEVESDIKNNNTTGRLSELKTSIDQMDSAVDTLYNNQGEISQAINAASAKLDLANSQWPTFKNAIQTAAAKLNSVNEGDLDKLISLSDVDQNGVNNYFESPLDLEKEHMYPVKTYGSALAPFYIAISLWIGGIISVAMLTMRVKSRKKYHSASVYLGRMGIFLIISIFQALVIIVGVLWLHVQISSPLLFALVTVYISMCSMLIVYSMTSAIGNAGKALAIIVLVLQITGTAGIFPLELLPSFFQAIHPYLPLTYAVGALREVVAGVLWSNFWYNMELLTVFPAVTFVLTFVIKEKMDKRAQWMEEKLEESGLF
ncbi:YhgE/Pip domain-containing protein [Methanobacterium paludis]|nr:YhgE/Pip domain-containing protein [Methanobacterium paludis]